MGVAACRPKGFSQFCFQHLAVVVLRQGIGETVLLGALEAGDLRQAQLIEHCRGHLLAVASDDEGDDFLAPVGMRPTHHRTLEDCRMTKQDFLDFARVDVGAATDDHVLRAVAKGQIAPLVHRTDIACPEPAIAKRLLRRRRIVPVARHHAIASGHHFAHLATGQFATLVINHLDFNAGAGDTA